MQELKGKKFGYWTVVAYKGKVKSRDVWLCKCVCGKENVLQARTLLNGDTTSCGCVSNKKRVVSLKGKRFGRLVVSSFAYTKNRRAYWNCICDCGKQKIVSGHSLQSGNTTSCGCINHGIGQIRKNLKGKRFGHLTATKWLGVIDGRSIWECKCDCGNTTKVQGYSLLQGKIMSCGCKHYKESDTKELAEKYHRHTSTINLLKKQLFGEYVYVLNEKQLKVLDNYFNSCQQKGYSKGEQKVLNFVKSIYNGNVLHNDRELIAPKELDIYIPEKHFAIEFDGLYWHSEVADCFSNYHLGKTKACMEKGVRLLHIYDSEWRDKQDICKSMIASALGIYERKEYARKCEVREIKDRKTVIAFFNANHIQGAVTKYSLALGLYKGDELLQAVVFGKQHFGKNGDMELYRMVTKINTQVLGGFSKLMEHSPFDTVVSYVALRMFDAKGYLAGKWKIESQAQPSFCITDGINMYSRHLFKKAECLKKFDNVTEDMTEREMQVKNGFYRVWDCGTYRVRWNRYLTT